MVTEKTKAKIPAGYKPLKGSKRFLSPSARLVGPADEKEMLTVSIRLRRRPDAPALPDQQTWAATPVTQRKFLSPEDLTSRIGAAQDDVDRVVAFAKKHGLKVVDTNIARRTVILSGSVKQMSEAFAVKLGRYASTKETYRGREDEIYLPPDLTNAVEGVFGLDNRRAVRRRRSAPPGASALTPQIVGQLYHFPPSPNVSGQTIGIIEFGGGYVNTDIQAYFNKLNLPAPTISDVSVDGAINSPGTKEKPNDDDIEVVLDIDVAGSASKGAKIAMYFAPNTEQGFTDAITTAMYDTKNHPSVLSISWAGAELDWTRAAISSITSAFKEAASLGITVLVSSGDQGSDCLVGDGHAHVEYPSSDPWVVGCGGTIITNVVGQVFTQGTWNDGGATGGGISDVFDLPTWQQGVGVPRSANSDHRIGRGVPDVAGNASHDSGYVLMLYGALTDPIGGTSAVAPLYAALTALFCANLDRRIGWINPQLYALRGSNVFQDINDGVSNEWSQTKQPAPAYNSGPGWDACTGLGSIDGKALLTALTQTIPAPAPPSSAHP